MDVAALRESLRRLAPTAVPVLPAERPPLPTGFAALDSALRGGVPRGQLTEIAGAISSGKMALALGLAAGLTGAGALAAFIDGRRQLYPPAAAALGVDLARLLVVRPPPGPVELARAAEIIAQSRSFPLIVIDLPRGARFDRTPAHRLRAAAHGTGTAVVVLSDGAGAAFGAAVVLEARAAPPNIQDGERRLSIHIHKGTGGGPGHAEVAIGPVHVPAALEGAA